MIGCSLLLLLQSARTSERGKAAQRKCWLPAFTCASCAGRYETLTSARAPGSLVRTQIRAGARPRFQMYLRADAPPDGGDRNRRMRCPLLVCSALAIGAVVCFGSDAHARERPVFCDPPTVTVVARGAIVGGKLCDGPWGCRCAHWFCPQCSTLPTRPVSCPPSLLSCATSPLSCEWTTCAPLYRPPARARR